MKSPTRRQRLAIVVLLVLSAMFVTLDYRGGSFDGVRSGVATVFGPVQRGFSATFGPVGRFLGGIPHIGSTHAEIAQLQRRNADLRRQLRLSGIDSARSDQLRRLDLLAGTGQLRVVPAVTISFGPSLGFEWTVTLDVGSNDGVAEGMTVVDGDGLVGRVKRVNDSTSVVVLAVDPGSSVGVRQEGSGSLGLVTGSGLSPLSYDPLDPRGGISVGDRLVTGPYGGSTYVPGIPVGEVTHVNPGHGGQVTADVRPYVKMTSLDLVGVVVTGPRTDPRDSMLPRKPKRLANGD
ncbi:MAG TPA: rod shape-determining protein MreC [Mycobacteriales bacterium]|nr:rod shape-determining protein MreC [Mycobacteriales bacterium]